LGDIKIPSDRFSHSHLDLIGPFPVSQGKNHCLTIIERTTNWSKEIPLLDISAPSIAQALHKEWIARFDMPIKITTDRGPQFSCSLIKQLAQILGIKKIRTTAYHPQANVQVERFHRSLKTSVACIFFLQKLRLS